MKKMKLSYEAKKYEYLYVNYSHEMETKGKTWKSANNRFLQNKLGIPIELLKEIKIKYCPFSRKVLKNEKKRKLLKKNPLITLNK